MKSNLPEAARKRQGLFLLCLPLVLLPLFGLIRANTQPDSVLGDGDFKGLNLELPSPNLEKRQASKADAYQAAHKEENKNKDFPLPDFLTQSQPGEVRGNSSPLMQPSQLDRGGFGLSTDIYSQSPEYELRNRITDLESLIAHSKREQESVGLTPDVENPRRMEQDAELLQLQLLMDRLQAGKGQPDPEILQLENLMDKILLLRYPERISNEEIPADPDFIPIPIGEQSIPELSGGNGREEHPSVEVSNGFFGFSQDRLVEREKPLAYKKTFLAAVSRTQEIIPGEALELVLEQELILGNEVLEAGTEIFAQTSLEGSRLQLQISGVLKDGVLLPVLLKGYSQDGIPGIELSGKKGAAQWIQNTGQSAQAMNLNLMGMDWQSQLANSGIQATRSLIRSQSKIRKIEIKAGHPLLLIDFSTSKSQIL